MTPINPPTDDLPAGTQPDDEALLKTARRLSSAPRPQMPPDMATRIRLQVQQAHAAQTASQPRPGKVIVLPVLRWVAAVAVLVLIGMAAVVPASAGSVPGDALYSVKLGLEKIELALASAEREPAVHLRQANRRLEEARKLIERQRIGEELRQIIDVALTSLESAGQSASRVDLTPETLASLRTDTQRLTSEIALVIAVVDDLNDEHMLLEHLESVIDAGSLLVTSTPTPTPTLTLMATQTATATDTQVPASATNTHAPATATATDTHVPATNTQVPPTVSVTATTTPTPDVTGSPMPEPAVFTAYVIAEGNANVRSGPGTGHPVIGQAARGSAVTVLNAHDPGDWWYVRLESGTTGWMAASLLSQTPPAPRPGPPGDPSTPVPGDPSTPRDDCDLPGAACDAPGHGGEVPPGQTSIPPGLIRTPDPPGRRNP